LDSKNCSISTTFPIPLSKGDLFSIQASNCTGGGHKPKEYSSLRVSIYYTVSIGSLQADRSEVGYINGAYT